MVTSASFDRGGRAPRMRICVRKRSTHSGYVTESAIFFPFSPILASVCRFSVEFSTMVMLNTMEPMELQCWWTYARAREINPGTYWQCNNTIEYELKASSFGVLGHELRWGIDL
uniref:Uncharacterized protein n=1 Tax=Physcomitrium patens TaxID=3218 RepID=A9RR42_PHYPA|nr:hypothetical protein PHYPA_008057 [Physcomitrium patens]